MRTSAEQRARYVGVERRRVAEVAHVDALVGAVHERSCLEQRLVLVREEAVRDAVGEGDAEVTRVGEAGQHRPARSTAPGSFVAIHASIASRSGESIGERLPDHALGELDPEAVLAEHLVDRAAHLVFAEAGRDAAVDLQLPRGSGSR